MPLCHVIFTVYIVRMGSGPVHGTNCRSRLRDECQVVANNLMVVRELIQPVNREFTQKCTPIQRQHCGKPKGYVIWACTLGRGELRIKCQFPACLTPQAGSLSIVSRFTCPPPTAFGTYQFRRDNLSHQRCPQVRLARLQRSPPGRQAMVPCATLVSRLMCSHRAAS